MNPPRKLTLHSFSEWSERPPPNWLVPGFIPEAAIGSITGPPGAMKSWLLITLAFRMSDGADWFGHKLEKYSTVYVAAENPGSHARRQAMYMRRNNSPGLGAFLIAEPIDLLSDACFEELKATVIRAKELSCLPCKLIIIDTLRDSWCGDENSSTESARALTPLKRLRDELGVTVIFAHHSGHNGERERGSSNWRANVDFAWKIKLHANTATATCTKMRDGPTCNSFSFRLDEDQKGDLGIEFVSQENKAPRRKPLSGQNKLAFEALNDAITDHGELLPSSLNLPTGMYGVTMGLWRKTFHARRDGTEATKEKAFSRAITDLQNSGRIGKKSDLYWPAPTE